MSGIEKICFQLIANSGEAKQFYADAIMQAREGQFEVAKNKMAAGDETFQIAHQVHAELIKNEANNQKTELTLLLIHAEDQMMSTESYRALADELIHVYQELKN